MMTVSFFLLFCFLFNFNSFHSLLVLLIIETLVLFCLFLILSSGFSLIVVIFFLVVVVCVGAYGISLLVSFSRTTSMSNSLLF